MEQWRQALGHANARRVAQHRLRLELVAGRVTIEQALGDPAVQDKPVRVVVGWLHPYGKALRVDDLLLGLGIWPNRRCGRLSATQRRRVGERAR